MKRKTVATATKILVICPDCKTLRTTTAKDGRIQCRCCYATIDIKKNQKTLKDSEKNIMTCGNCGTQRTTSNTTGRIQCRDCYAVIHLDNFTDKRFKG